MLRAPHKVPCLNSQCGGPRYSQVSSPGSFPPARAESGVYSLVGVTAAIYIGCCELKDLGCGGA